MVFSAVPKEATDAMEDYVTTQSSSGGIINVPQRATELLEEAQAGQSEDSEAGQGGTRKAFAQALLTEMGADPNDLGNVQTLVKWMTRENTSAGFNPLAIALSRSDNPDVGFFNDLQNANNGYAARGDKTLYGVRNFRNFDEGVTETVKFLQKGYSDMIAAFVNGTDPESFSDTFSSKLHAWSGGGYRGIADTADNSDERIGTTQGTSESSGLDESPALSPEEGGEPLDFFLDQYGGYGLLLGNENDSRFRIGVIRDANGKIIRTVPASSAEATDFVNIIDYITDTGITNDSRVLGLLQQTDWWAKTDQAAREFDVKWAEYSNLQKKEYLEPLMDTMRRKADQLGFVYQDVDLFQKAAHIMRLGDSEDEEYLNTFILADSKQAAITSEATEFGASKDSIATMADSYFLTLDPDEVTSLAEQVYTGELTELELGQEFKNRAVGLFPSLSNVITEMGVTPKQYFNQHITEIETLLERPVDFKREFLNIVEHVDENGNVRPKTLSETRKHVRKTSEWQGTKNAENEARTVVAAIGEAFGKVAY